MSMTAMRRRFVFGAVAIVAAGAGAPAQPLGVGALAERVEDAQALGASGVGQLDACEVPARDAQVQLAQNDSSSEIDRTQW